AALATSAFASAARDARAGADLSRTLRRLTRWVVVAGIPILVLIAIVVPPLFAWAFGSEWQGGSDLVFPLAAAQLAALISIPAAQTLQATGRTDVQVVVSAARFAAAVMAFLVGHALG